MVPRTTASTRLVVLLGHPVAHSASPQIHSAAFAAAGIDAVYVALDVQPEDVEGVIAGLAAAGAMGANVTVPHKAAALAAADMVTDEAEIVGAANTLVFSEGRITATNTDAEGLGDVLDADVGLAPGDLVRLVGSGGAARAAAVALGRRGATVAVCARRDEPARQVAELVERVGGVATGAPGTDPRVVINATPLGLQGEALPDGLGDVGPGQVALDLTYGRRLTPFLMAADQAGARALDGRGMLVAQAGRSFTVWTGRPAPLQAMHAAVEAALAGD